MSDTKIKNLFLPGDKVMIKQTNIKFSQGVVQEILEKTDSCVVFCEEDGRVKEFCCCHLCKHKFSKIG